MASQPSATNKEIYVPDFFTGDPPFGDTDAFFTRVALLEQLLHYFFNLDVSIVGAEPSFLRSRIRAQWRVCGELAGHYFPRPLRNLKFPLRRREPEMRVESESESESEIEPGQEQEQEQVSSSTLP